MIHIIRNQPNTYKNELTINSNRGSELMAERSIQILKLIEAGDWPSTFEPTRQAEKFLQKKVRSFNEDFDEIILKPFVSSQLQHTLTQEEHKASLVVAHWEPKKGEVSDVISTKIQKFKREATEAWKPANWSPENSLNKTEHYPAIAARHPINQERVNDQPLKKQQLELATESTKNNWKELRGRASESVYNYLMSLKRSKHISRYVWARNRIAITLLRFLGLRASDVASVTLKDIQSGLRHGSFQLLQAKTGQYRVVVLSQTAKQMIEELDLDVKTVFGEDYNKPLASAANSTKQIRKNEWVRSINRFMKPAIFKFNLILTSHSFRINYVTKLLRQVPSQKVKTIVGHKDIRTTERYDRFVIDPESVSELVETALNTNNKENQKFAKPIE